MKSVDYISSECLSCAKCGGAVILCLSPALVVGSVPYIEGTLVTTEMQFNACGKQAYLYGITYDETSLVDQESELTSESILGVVCRGCLTTYIDSKTSTSYCPDSICPDWYGAKGDGITDDTVAIELAIVAAAAAKVPVWFSNTYVGEELDLQNYTVIDGYGTIVKKAGTVTSLLGTTTAALYHDITIRNVTLDGNKAHCTAGSAITIAGYNLRVEHVTMQNTAHAGVEIGYRAGGKNIHVINNRILNPSLMGAKWGGIAVTGGQHVVVAGNIVESVDGAMTYGIDVEPNAGTPATEVGNIIITDNIIIGGRVYIDGGNLVGTLKNIVVKDNLIDARGSYASNFTNDSPLWLRGTSYSSFSGNTIFSIALGSTTNPIYGICLESNNSNFVISNNICYCDAPLTSGSAIRMLASSSYGLINGNLIVSTSANLLTYGIQAYNAAAGDHLTVRDNKFQNVTNWYSIGDVNSKLERAIAKGTTPNRPSLLVLDVGVQYFDTTLNANGLPIWWNGTAWIKADGTIV